MTTTDVVHDLGEKWLPLPPEQFFKQQIDRQWFAGELPPTVQDELRSPLVTQSKLMLKYSVLQQLSLGAQREVARQEMARRQHAKARVGKRVKTSRH